MSISIEKLINQSKSVGIASRDAGGANIINSLIKNFQKIKFKSYVDGPAKNILDSENIIFVENHDILLKKIDLLILGTGSSSFEKEILKIAKKYNIVTISILDHFVNFKERFQFEKNTIYPDYCFVCDKYALKIAKEELFPFNQIYICKNYYVDTFKKYFTNNIPNNSSHVLYILENIKEKWGQKPPWEIAFFNFYNNYYKKNNKLKKIIVRPHPKDDPITYKELNKIKDVVFDLNISPINSLLKSSIVVGAESYFLYLAKESGFDVFTSIPSSIRKPRLPEEIYKVIN